MIITKIVLLFLFFQSPDTVFVEENLIPSDVVIHDSLFTNNEVSLDLSELKGWRFSPEDDPAFALTNFDDSQWYIIGKSLRETNKLPDSLWQGFGWLRLRLRVDSSFSRQLNVISPHVMGGTELYINGELVLKHGVPGVTAEEQELLGAILDLGTAYEFLPGATYQIAVRYSLHHLNTLRHLSLGSYVQPILLSVFVTNYDTINRLIHRTIITTSIFAFAAAILLMVMILHLFMHLSGAEGKTNFAILVLSACMFLLSLLIFSMGFSIRNFWLYIILSSSAPTTLTLMCCSLIPWVTHLVLEVPVAVFWKRFVFAPILLVVFLASFPEFPYEGLVMLIGALIIILTVTGCIQAIIKARKRKKTGISLIAGSLLAYPILFITIFILAANGLSYFWNSIIIFLMLISMPVGMSIKQAKQFLKLHIQLDSLVRDRTAELSKSLSDLKATQSQLIHSEKMASLGELTAGIAHEIQNPLNFVNNFSEVNTELIEELKMESGKPKTEWNETLIKETLDNLKDNEQKIVHHGKRADAIVKSMLQHSRSSSGKKELTDINALCDEYLRLAYHGLRAKDKSFNAKFDAYFDPSIPIINVVPQDIGRVVLNLINNAFYAVNERLRQSQFGGSYEPTVKVSTRNLSDRIQISVEDNGIGIPEYVREKIFQPFFTTKPTGQGTGLGLSLSYDIVKAHGGELQVTTRENAGTEFTIVLPIQTT